MIIKQSVQQTLPCILTSDSDFKTPQEGILFGDVTVTFVKEGGNETVKTIVSADWTEKGTGIYEITFRPNELDTVGKFLFTVIVDGCLPYYGEVTIREYLPVPPPSEEEVVDVIEDQRKGFAFDNPDLTGNRGWGSIITPDELRYVYAFGNDLVAPSNGATFSDKTLQWYINNAIKSVEKDLNINILKKRWRYKETVFNQGRDVSADTAFEGSEASFTGTVSLSSNVDLTIKKNLKIAIDKGNYITVDCSGAIPTSTTPSEIVSAINTAFGSVIASLVIDGRNTFLKISSLVRLEKSFVEFETPATVGSDALKILLGLEETTGYHYIYQGWIQGKDYFWEDPYDFDRKAFNNYIYMKLKRRPLLKLHHVEFRDIAGGKVADILSWAKPNYKMGSLEFFPHTGALASLPLYAGSSFPLANAYQAISNYPDGFFLDYDSGFDNVLAFNEEHGELIQIIGMISAVNVLLDFGDGKTSNIATSSIGIAGISESVSYASASAPLFGAKIEAYQKSIAEFYKENKRKYSGIFLGSL